MHPASHRLQLGGDIDEQEAHPGYRHLQEAWVGGILEVSCAGEFKHEALAEAQPEKCSRVYVYCLFFGSRVCIPFQELVIVGRVPAEKYL